MATFVQVHNSRQLSETRAQVAHTYEVAGELHEALSLVVEAETGVRGFIIAGEEPFLGRYDVAQTRIGPQLRRIQELTAKNPEQQRRAFELERLATEKAQFMARVLAVAREQGADAARQLLLTGVGVKAMEAVREVIAAMEAEEERLLQVTQSQSQAKDRMSLWISAILAVLMMAALLGAYLLIRFHVAERRQAEEERDRFFTLSLDMLAIGKTDGYFKRLNPAFTQTLGWSEKELLERPFMEFVHPEDRAATVGAMEHLSKGQLLIQFENRYETKDGSWRVLSWKGSPQPDGMLYCTARDVTEHRQAVAALEEARHEADRANLAKSEFLSRMSHELRTPMNAILGFAQIMEMGNPPEQLRVPISHITRAGAHLLDLINEVLDIARIEAGRMSISVEPVRLREVVEECFELIRPIAGQRSIRLEGGDLDCDRHVLADRQRLKQALLNLLSNAVKFNRDGGSVTLTYEEREPDRTSGMTSREFAQDQRLRLNIADTGSGISAADVLRLFEPFERLDADRRGIEGTGLGLALTKRLIELMGASISVESEEDRGSVFSLEFNLVQSPMARGEASAAGTSGSAAGLIGSHTVLYIEDNLSNLQLIEHVMIHRPGVKLLAAMQGSLGLDLAREHRPQLILLDLNLPDIPGHEVLRRLRGEIATREIPVVIISADATPGEIQRMLAAGAEDYLTKPLDIKKFLSVVGKHLNSGNNV
ncbi:MAG TPA: CHASE3 domain-containing protein [Chthoniobacteraceae bacterium]